MGLRCHLRGIRAGGTAAPQSSQQGASLLVFTQYGQRRFIDAGAFLEQKEKEKKEYHYSGLLRRNVKKGQELNIVLETKYTEALHSLYKPHE